MHVDVVVVIVVVRQPTGHRCRCAERQRTAGVGGQPNLHCGTAGRGRCQRLMPQLLLSGSAGNCQQSCEHLVGQLRPAASAGERGRERRRYGVSMVVKLVVMVNELRRNGRLAARAVAGGCLSYVDAHIAAKVLLAVRAAVAVIIVVVAEVQWW